MKIRVSNIQKDGDATKEYVLLEVLEDCDIGEYLVADNTFTSKGNVSNKLRHVYWFPDKKVKKGEFVSLRTGKGASSVDTLSNGARVHRFYWNLGSAVWNDDSVDAAVLMHVSEWQQASAN